MDQLGKVRQHHWKERLQISQTTNFESDMAHKSRHFTDVCMTGSTNLPPNIQRSVNFRNFAKLYRKIPKISPRGLYFSKILFEGLIFGGAYIRRDLCTEGNLRLKIDWASLIL